MYVSKMAIVSSLALLVSILGGCATMSEAECENANWQLRGEDDGRAGRRREQVNEHTKACAEFGVKPDLAQYDRGWQQGIREFCTRENGWKRGLNGSTYNNSCPAELGTAFYEAFKRGSKLYDQQSRITSLEADLGNVNEELEELVDNDSKRKKLKHKKKRIKKELAEAETELLLLKLRAEQAGYSTPSI